MNVSEHKLDFQADEEDNSFKAKKLTEIFIKCVCIILTVFGNTAVVVATRRNKWIRWLPVNVLICSLAVSDLMVGAVLMPIDTFTSLIECKNFFQLFGGVYHNVSLGVHLSSMWKLCIISYDTYRYSRDKAKYRATTSTCKVTTMVVSGWLIPIGLFMLTYLAHILEFKRPDKDFYQLTFSLVITVVPSLATLFFYIRIIQFSRKRNTKISMVAKRSYHIGTKQKPYRQRIRLISFLIWSFYILWLPGFLVFIFSVMIHSYNCTVMDILTWVTYGDSLLNPFIYVAFHPVLRKGICMVFTCQRQRPEGSFADEMTTVTSAPVRDQSPPRVTVDTGMSQRERDQSPSRISITCREASQDLTNYRFKEKKQSFNLISPALSSIQGQKGRRVTIATNEKISKL